MAPNDGHPDRHPCSLQTQLWCPVQGSSVHRRPGTLQRVTGCSTPYKSCSPQDVCAPEASFARARTRGSLVGGGQGGELVAQRRQLPQLRPHLAHLLLQGRRPLPLALPAFGFDIHARQLTGHSSSAWQPPRPTCNMAAAPERCTVSGVLTGSTSCSCRTARIVQHHSLQSAAAHRHMATGH